jgi:hypothetical protein
MISEALIVKAVIDFFSDESNIYIKEEVQLFDKFIDIFCHNKNLNEYLAIEAKVKSPTKAFLQASKYLHVAHYVYVATLKNGSNKKAFELSDKTGIGLIFVEFINDLPKVEIVMESRKSPYYLNHLSEQILYS